MNDMHEGSAVIHWAPEQINGSDARRIGLDVAAEMAKVRGFDQKTEDVLTAARAYAAFLLGTEGTTQ